LIPKTAKVRVQLYDSDALADQLLCNEPVSGLASQAASGQLQVVCSSGARVWLAVEPARAKLGLGIRYEVRDKDVVITGVARYSPASRAGLKTGDEIVKIQGKDVQSLVEGQAQSLINANSRSGLQLTLRRSDGKLHEVDLEEGPVYLLAGVDTIFEQQK
jgi:S1-C subfamily serine protease